MTEADRTLDLGMATTQVLLSGEYDPCREIMRTLAASA
jgi:hypothetical protein